MVNPPSLLSDNWFVFTGSGGIAIFAISVSAIAIISGEEPSYLNWVVYIGLGLFFISVIIWGIYRLLRRIGLIGPAPRNLQQVQNNLEQRVSELERELREEELNEAGDVNIGDESDVTVIQR